MIIYELKIFQQPMFEYQRVTMAILPSSHGQFLVVRKKYFAGWLVIFDV